MRPLTKKTFALVLFFMSMLFQDCYAQSLILKKDWIVRVSGGMSYLMTELERDFSNSYVEMNSLASGTYTGSIEKMINRNLDVAIEGSFTTFTGFKNNPSNVAWLMNDSRFGNFQPFAVDYTTNLATIYLKARYHFSPFYSIRRNFTNTNLYCMGGVGWSSIGVCLGYKDPGNYVYAEGLHNPIFAKGSKYRDPRLTHCSVTMGLGIRHHFSNRIAVDVEIDAMGINADYLDGIHNFKLQTTTSGESSLKRVPVYDVVGSLTVGVSYYFHAKLKNADLQNLNDFKWQSRKTDYRNERFHDRRNVKKAMMNKPFSYKK